MAIHADIPMSGIRVLGCLSVWGVEIQTIFDLSRNPEGVWTHPGNLLRAKISTKQANSTSLACKRPNLDARDDLAFSEERTSTGIRVYPSEGLRVLL